jgi:UDP-glucose 4-epimerase
MMRRVLVTGGAGFIGSHVADLFIANGWDVTVVDDLSSGKRENLSGAAELHEISVTSPEFARLVGAGKFDVVAHLSGQIGVRISVDDPIADATTNILGTLNLMEALRASRSQARVVCASTGGLLYGDFNTPPNLENYPKDPESPYAVAKLSVEYYLAYYSRVHHREYAALRLCNVYGPRQDPNGEAGVVAIFCGRILNNRPLTVFGDGHQTRDYVYVGDAARAFWLAATKPLPATGRLDERSFNIGTGTGTTVLDLARLLQDAAGTEVAVEFTPPPPGEQQKSLVNADKARAVLEWVPRVELADGLAKTYEWFAQQGKGVAV